jgi:hypothetical protein
MNTITAKARGYALALRARVAASLRVQCLAATACLPAAFASLLIGFVPAPCTAAVRPDLQAQIERVAHDSSITLQLADGRAISGAFYGFLGDWRDSVDSPVRYESWRRAHPEGLPRLGESLKVVLASGDSLRGSFEGVGPNFLALGSSGLVNMFAFSGVTAVRSDSGGSVLSWADLRGRLVDAPPVIGIGLKLGAQVVVVPRESIFSVNGTGGSSGDNSRLILVLVAIGVTVALVAVCVNRAANDAANSANSVSNSASTCANASANGRSYDRRFGASNVSRGLDPWPAGETRRP